MKKTDKFTKITLGIIAINLTILTLGNINLFPKAYASESENKFLDVPNNVNYGLVPLNEDGSINVKIISTDVLDVRLRGIDEASNLRWESIPVKIQD